MTGFGRGTAEEDGTRFSVEISAVNSRKKADFRLVIPREVSALEPFLRRVLHREVHRGALTVSVNCKLSPEILPEQDRINWAVAGKLVTELKRFAEESGINGDVRAGELLAVPGVAVEDASVPCDGLVGLAEEALSAALVELREMQEIEGEKLYKDLNLRFERLKNLTARMKECADEVLLACRRRLHERIGILGVDVEIDEERLAKEVAYLAERSDITEELVRLDSHLAQCEDKMRKEEAPGKPLDFICIEMNREISTLCAKTSDTEVAELGLDFKAELGRIREQILNVE